MTTQKSTILFASDPSIMYSPPNAWDIGQNGSTTTSQPGATAQLNFSGSFIEVYGIFPKNVASAPVSHYTLDNETPLIFTTPIGNESDSHSPFVFYEANPANGNHSLLITLESGEQLDLSFIVFADPEEFPAVPSSSTLIGGIVFAAVTVMVGAILVFYHIYRRKKGKVSGPGYSPNPEPFLFAARLRRPTTGSSVAVRHSRVLSIDPSSHSAIFESAVQPASITESSYIDEKASLKNPDQRTSSENIVLPRSPSVHSSLQLHPPSTLHSSTSDAPPSYKTVYRVSQW
ncbi:hypothetical protein BDP27DRAFT_1312573 [Rhodocollybia butyracea]|uniref:Uncharacterized protein n=1 Tax=Rhodocollybia butyracea TaxID=206335 RepID=A0A9P5Q7T1_9AGAR|nr:hypothetical protein BDP27DRAFT_1312573 [Rhodocollybia butyracea]